MPSNVEWLNQNSNRAFPFREDASRKDTAGGITLPNNFLVDMVFVVPADVDETYHVSSVQVSAGKVTVVIAAATAAVSAGSVTVDLSVHSENDAYDINGASDFTDARGRAVFGDLSNLGTVLPDGLYLFSSSAGALESRVVRPDIRSVRSLQILDAAGALSDPISGIVRLVPGNNIRLSFQPEETTDIIDPITGDPVTVVSKPAGIRIDAICDPDFSEECECESSYPKPDPIRMINGVTGDENGEVTLDGGESCITFNGGGSATIEVLDTCSQPCCGCPELEFITQNLILLEDSINKLVSRADELASRQEDFYNTVLGSLM